MNPYPNFCNLLMKINLIKITVSSLESVRKKLICQRIEGLKNSLSLDFEGLSENIYKEVTKSKQKHIVKLFFSYSFYFFIFIYYFNISQPSKSLSIKKYLL